MILIDFRLWGWVWKDHRRLFHRSGIEHRFLEGRFDGPAEEGTGLAVTRVYDAQRLVAVATQCLLGTSFDAG